MTRLLLDTHTFLWWDSNPGKLSARVLALCQDPAVVLYLSLVSLWEIQIKSGLGKLPLDLPPREIVRVQQAQCDLRRLPIIPAHIFALEALSEGLPLASVDSQFPPYPASIIW